jgi:iron complex outermembrane receptor protein
MRRLTYSTWTVLYKAITGFSISALLTVNATAQDLVTEGNLFDEIPIVLSASRLAQPVTEAPAAVTIIDQQMIKASGARNLVDIFRLVPGFVTANWSGHRAIVAPYGMADVFSRRMQILIDGRSVFTPDFGGVAWSDLPLALEDIEKIEVVRGPNAVTFGANSFLSVINIITKYAAAIRGTHIKYTTGRQDTSDTLLQYGNAGKDLDYRLTVSRQTDSGFIDINDDRKISFFNGRLDYRASNNDTINFQFGASGGELGEGEFGDIVDPERDERINTHFQHIRWSHLSDTTSEYSLQYYHNYNESKDSFSTDIVIDPGLGPVTIPGLLFDFDVTSERHDVEFQHKLEFDNYLRLVWGLNARQDTVEADRIFNNTSKVENNLWRTFVNTEWRLSDSLLIHAGTMLESTSITDKEFSSRVAVNYHFTPQHTIRASYSVATRNPVLFEEKAEWRVCALGLDSTCSQLVTLPAPYNLFPQVSSYDVVARSSGGLVPEKITTRDVGYLTQLTNSLYFDIRFSRSEIDHLIDWVKTTLADDFSPPALDFVSRDVTYVLNTAELQASYTASENDRLLLTFSHMDIKSGLDTSIRNYTSSVPKKVGSLLVMHNFQDGFKGSLGYYFLDNIKHLDSKDVGAKQLDERKQLDLILSRQFSIGSSEAEISGVIQNVLDDYKDYNGKNNVSTRYYLNFSLKLN